MLWHTPAYYRCDHIKRQMAIRTLFPEQNLAPQKDTQKLVDNVPKVLALLYKVGAMFVLEKFSFITDTIYLLFTYLSNAIRFRRLRLASNKADAIRGLMLPTSLTELSSFLGLCIVFWGCVPTFQESCLQRTNNRRKTNQIHLHRLVPKNFKPWML